MEELPLFFQAIQTCKLFHTAVTTRQLSDTDVEGLVYTRPSKYYIILQNFDMPGYDVFKEVGILMTGYGVLIDFITDDTKFFRDAAVYFNTSSVARARAPLIHQGHLFPVRGKKINRYNLFSKSVHGTVMLSDFFGCKIMTAFF